MRAMLVVVPGVVSREDGIEEFGVFHALVADQEVQRTDPHVQLRSKVLGILRRPLRGGIRGHTSDAAADTGAGPGRRAACAALRTRRHPWSRRSSTAGTESCFRVIRCSGEPINPGVIPVPQHRTTPTLSFGTAFGVLMVHVITTDGMRVHGGA
jgi:hypothetical protein